MHSALKSVLNGNIFAVYNFSYATLQYVSQCLNANYDLDFFFLFKQTKHPLFLSKQLKRSFRKLQFFVHLEPPKKMTTLGLGLLPFWNQIFYTIMVRYNSSSIYVNNKC